MAEVMLAGADYLTAGQDAAGQRAAVEKLTAAYKKTDGGMALNSVPMIFAKNPPAPEVLEEVKVFLHGETRSKMAVSVADALDRWYQAKGLMNAPLTLEKTLVDGKKFSTAQWKGKVILVDFWHTACGPCIAEMADIKELQVANGAKGFEVVGYSCDDTVKPVKAFLEQHKGYGWPQIFDAAHPGWDAAAAAYGLDMTPTVFLIDRKGVLRSVHTGIDKEVRAEVERLLAEKE
jgi:thiol-disulfide isomerase/thioredoxin